jgi:hypothetical protein
MSNPELIQNRAIARLTTLIAAGYVLNAPAHASDAVSLEHPNRKFKYRHAYVYEDGKVVAPFSDNDEVRIYTDSTDSDFHSFVRTIPKPSGLEFLSTTEFWSGIAVGLSAAFALYSLFVR